MRCSEGRVPGGGERYNKLFHRWLLMQCFCVFSEGSSNGDNGGKIPTRTPFSSPLNPFWPVCSAVGPSTVQGGHEFVFADRWPEESAGVPVKGVFQICVSFHPRPPVCRTDFLQLFFFFSSPAPSLAGKALLTGCQNQTTGGLYGRWDQSLGFIFNSQHVSRRRSGEETLGVSLIQGHWRGPVLLACRGKRENILN